MNTPLTLAYSPCPNDTFIFYALAHGRIDMKNLDYTITLADVETLNQCARTGRYDISKLSFAALGHVRDRYALLRSGAALGRGCGPLIVARPGFDFNKIHNAKIAVPGKWTTAYLLLSLFLDSPPDALHMSFEQVMPAVAGGRADAGVIIHEGRFTFADYGLDNYLDLGQWWEDKTGLPIPLGGIAIRRDIPGDIAAAVDLSIRESVDYAMSHRNSTRDYVRGHAREMDDDVIGRHIGLYVNDFSLALGAEGETAVNTLFAMAREKGAMTPVDLPIFI